jgi:hypothetical protein
MAVNKPLGDNARKGTVTKLPRLEPSWAVRLHDGTWMSQYRSKEGVAIQRNARVYARDDLTTARRREIERSQQRSACNGCWEASKK